MKGTPATRITILALFVLIAIAGALMFTWPIFQPERSAPVAATGTPAPVASAESSAPKPKPSSAPVTAAVDTLKKLADEVAPKPDPATDRAPSFDVARIEPNGEAVIGGRAAPGAAVELLRGNVTHARTTADPSGDFVLVPKPLPAGSYDLTLRATHKDGKVSTSKDSVAVVLRSDSKDKPVVALAEPDKPIVVLSKPTTDPAPAPSVVIDAVEGEAGGRMYVSGRAPPGAKVNLYLNDAYIASATASAEGRVAFSIRSGIRPGDYRIRLDQVDGSGRVQKRAEVPFTAPVTVAAAASSTTSTTSATVTQTPESGSDTANKMAAASTHPEPMSAPQAAPKPTPAPPPAAPSASAVSDKTATAPPAAEEPATSETTPPPDQQPPSQSIAAAEPGTPEQRTNADVTPPPAPNPAITAAATPRPTTTTDEATGVVVVPRVDTTVVNRGDSLWRISRTTYGRGVRYSVIYNANRGQIRNPDLIYPGQIFVLPKDKR